MMHLSHSNVLLHLVDAYDQQGILKIYSDPYSQEATANAQINLT
jgi:hypothetical protein